MASPRLYDTMSSSKGRRPLNAAPAPLGQDRFPIDYWLSPRVLLTPATPYSQLNEFCTRNGFFLSNIASINGHEDKRVAMFRLLTQLNWPAGYDSFMLARNSRKVVESPRSRPGSAYKPSTQGGVVGSDLEGNPLKSLDLGREGQGWDAPLPDHDYTETTITTIKSSRPSRGGSAADSRSPRNEPANVRPAEQVRRLQEENDALRESLREAGISSAKKNGAPSEISREVAAMKAELRELRQHFQAQQTMGSPPSSRPVSSANPGVMYSPMSSPPSVPPQTLYVQQTSPPPPSVPASATLPGIGNGHYSPLTPTAPAEPSPEKVGRGKRPTGRINGDVAPSVAASSPPPQPVTYQAPPALEAQPMPTAAPTSPPTAVAAAAPPQPSYQIGAPSGSGAVDPQVATLASVMGVRPADGGTWAEQFCFVADQLAQAIVLVDMTVPGVKLLHVNGASERLVEYPKAEQVGRNCRFMQGPATEAAAVRAMVRALRSASPSTLRITNYKKSGASFVNVLTLHPVFDSERTYRFSIGVQSDNALTAQEGAALETLRQALPTQFDKSIQHAAHDFKELAQVDAGAQQRQWRASLAKFTRLLWSLDWEGSLRILVSQKQYVSPFGQWLSKHSPEDAIHLELLVLTTEMVKHSIEQQHAGAIQLCQRYFNLTHENGETALADLSEQRIPHAMNVLANGPFAKFVQSKACLPLIESLLGSAGSELRPAPGLIWEEYTVPPDVAGWVHSFVAVAESFPACIVISDMTMPGNPMFFINQEFSRVTGYSKHEAQGRNCRFLQGPRTEPNSVAVIQDTLRRGVDCHVKLTNYRKTGDLFENLLTVRPVHDSNGVYRFCIGVQFEVSHDTPLKSRIAKLEKLIKLLPSQIDVESQAVGDRFEVREVAEEKAADLESKLTSALDGNTIGAQATELRYDQSEHFAENRSDMLEYLGEKPSAPSLSPTSVAASSPPPQPVTYQAPPAPEAQPMPTAAPTSPPTAVAAAAPPQPSYQIGAPSGSGAVDPQVATLASVMGVRPADGGTWAEQFCFVADQLAQAIVLVDMTVPGVKLLHVNGASERLVEYPKAEQVGRNCRFMQGPATEAAAVRAMVRALRSASPSTLRITNYKKSGASFVNVLTLHPVFDSERTYRFSIGVQSDNALTAQEGAALETLRQALPTQFDKSIQHAAHDFKELAQVDAGAQQRQWRASLAKFTRLLWSLDWEGSLRQLVAAPEHVSTFGRWLSEYSPADAMQLELLVLTSELTKQPPERRGPGAIQLCQRYLNVTHENGETALADLTKQSAAALSALASTSFAKFVQSKKCLPLIESLLGPMGSELRPAPGLIWEEYTVPPDVAGWVHSFVAVAESFPACIVISDMTMPGNPMFFINQEFSRVTGYSKHEAQGRNCRFLQGPRTEPNSVAVIQDTLRRGVDCHVKLTNYRKTGDLFENLLTMRPVHDSNGVYRFCIGVQFEVSHDMSLKSRIAKLEKLIKLLPSQIDVESQAVGDRFEVREVAEEKAADLESKLTSALDGNTIGAQATELRYDQSEHFAENRSDMLEYLGEKPSAPSLSPTSVAASSPPPQPVTYQAPPALEAQPMPTAAPTSPPTAVAAAAPPQPSYQIGAPSGSGAVDPQVATLASVMGVRPADGGTWAEQFCFVADQLAQAIVLVDMTVPGVKLLHVNGASERLVEYPKAEQVGRNCRFMQGPATEAAAVRAMVRALRSASPSTLRITNYKKSGASFVNVLTLHPVFDSERTYRFSIGVQSDNALTAQEGAALETLRQALPTQFDKSIQHAAHDFKELAQVDANAQQRQWRASLAKFTRLLWSLDWESSLRQLVAAPEHVSTFGRWLSEYSPADAMQLELLVLTSELTKQPPERRGPGAIQLCQRYLNVTHENGETALADLTKQSAAALSALASTSFAKFVQSKKCLPLIESLLGPMGSELRPAPGLIWEEYTVPPDVAGWVHSFVAVAESFPACIVISDMTMPGNPMFFINQEFSRVTGYSKHEAQGRNCRFLQGPRTEPNSVAVIQDTLRRGVDCHVKLTNYRKTGDLFENLLTMRPVHDSNGVYRFCIGVQFEVSHDMSLKSRIAKLEKLIKLLPSQIDVESQAVGDRFEVREVAEEKAADLESKLTSALDGNTIGAQATELRYDQSEHFAENRSDMLEYLGGRPS